MPLVPCHRRNSRDSGSGRASSPSQARLRPTEAEERSHRRRQPVTTTRRTVSHGPLGNGRSWVTAPSAYFDRFAEGLTKRRAEAVVCPLPAVTFREASRHYYRGERLRFIGGCWLVLKDGCPLVSHRRWPRFSPRAPSYHTAIGWAPGAHPPRGDSWDDAIDRWSARQPRSTAARPESLDAESPPVAFLREPP